MKVDIVKLDENAKVPTYATLGSAGFDFYSLQEGQVTYGGPVIFGTGVSMKIPDNHVLLVFSRSGHGFKDNVRLSNAVGVIDSDYTGEIKVKLSMDFPSWQNTLHVKVGDRIAQGVILPVCQAQFNVVEKLPETERGAAGFGSTGV